MQILAALLLLFGQNVDETAKTYHVFPQIADGGPANGSKFNSPLFVTNTAFVDDNHCTYELHGVDADRLYVISDFATATANGATFTLSQALPGMAIPTLGVEELQTGYATLQCSHPVAAFVTYNYSDRLGRTIGMATVFSSQPGTAIFYWVIHLPGRRLGVAIANDANSDTDCEISVFGEQLVGMATVTVEAKSNVARFIDEFVFIPADTNFVGGTALLVCPSPVSTIGLYFDGVVFTTVPAAVFVE